VVEKFVKLFVHMTNCSLWVSGSAGESLSFKNKIKWVF